MPPINDTHTRALAAFDDILPLLHQTAKLVTDCPFEDPDDSVALSVLVATYFVGSAIGIADKVYPGDGNGEALVAAIANEVAARKVRSKGETS